MKVPNVEKFPKKIFELFGPAVNCGTKYQLLLTNFVLQKHPKPWAVSGAAMMHQVFILIVESSAEATRGQLDIGKMTGLFLIFTGFIGLAFLALFLECCYAAYSDGKKDRYKVSY